MKITITDDLHGYRFDSYSISVRIPADFRPSPPFEQILKTIWVDMVQKRNARHQCDPNSRVMIMATPESDDAQPGVPESAEHIVYDNLFEALRRLQILENWCVPYTVGMRFIHDFVHDYPIDIVRCNIRLDTDSTPMLLTAEPFSIMNDAHDDCYMDAISHIRKEGFDASFVLHEDLASTLLHVYDPDATRHISMGTIMVFASNFMEMAALLDETNIIDNTMASQLWVAIRALIKFSAEEEHGDVYAKRIRAETSDAAAKLRNFKLR